MKARAAELKAEAKADKKRSEGEAQVLEAIEEMPNKDAEIAKVIHAIVSEVAPELWPKTWYGMPAHAKEYKVVCFFQAASKFGTRYATFGLSDKANLDRGLMWPTAFAIVEVNADVKK